MNFSELVFSNSTWWLAVAVIAGLGYAAILYSKKGPWGQTLEKLLFFLRTLAVFILALLLINPLLKQIENTTVSPKAVLVIDNSTSLSESLSSDEIEKAFESAKSLEQNLKEKGFEVVVRDLSQEVPSIDSIKLDNATTNIASTLKTVNSQYQESALSLCILMTDGIYNLGSSPDYINLPFPVHTIALGDTIPKKDVIIKNVRYNKVVTQGNKFPIQVDVLHNGFEGTPLSVSLALNGSQIDSKRFTFDESLNIQTIEFIVDTEVTGLNRFSIDIPVQDNEQASSNNHKDVYIDIIDNKDKILILGSAPHPDMRALKSALEKNKNYEVIDYVPGVGKPKEDTYGVVISHAPYSGNRNADQLLETQQKGGIPIWYILDRRTSYRRFSELNSLVKIDQIRGQFDQVGTVLNTTFSKFNLATDKIEILEDFPPLRVPYGNISLKSPSETLFTQRVGSIASGKPLLVVGNSAEQKEAVLLGSGIWQWRIQEFAKEDEPATFDNWVSKLVQYLNTSEDKKKFRVTTSTDEYTDSEPVIFSVETYNNIYENIYNIPVELEISGQDGFQENYTFVTTETNSEYKVSGLKPGVYTYSASTSLSGKREVVNGGFSIVALQIESINLTADYDILRRLARKTDGTFSMAVDPASIDANFNNLQAQGIIYSEETLSPLSHLKWVLFLIILLVSAEWFIRKYSGGY